MASILRASHKGTAMPGPEVLGAGEVPVAQSAAKRGRKPTSSSASNGRAQIDCDHRLQRPKFARSYQTCLPESIRQSMSDGHRKRCYGPPLSSKTIGLNQARCPTGRPECWCFFDKGAENAGLARIPSDFQRRDRRMWPPAHSRPLWLSPSEPRGKPVQDLRPRIGRNWRG